MLGSRRSQIVTDQPVQGELLFRAIVYWCLCMVVLEILAIGWLMLNEPSQPFSLVVKQSLLLNAPAWLGSLFLLPLILFDLLRISSRFAGPIQNIRFALRQLAEGKPARRVYLRRDDYWQDLAYYTTVIAEKLEPESSESDPHEAPTSENTSALKVAEVEEPSLSVMTPLDQEDLVEV
jgi:hypothetical protein